MINRAREIAQTMGYDSIDATLEAIGRGELILLKVPEQKRLEVTNWVRSQIPEVRDEDAVLADVLDDIADGVDMAIELRHYPVDTDVCDMDLPHGWPSYCDTDALF
ncbi:MAG: hypothetical protein MUQ30_17715 [Anaerolineae bacterium]|nr:hypothetical protein [Anaerolineae bacterium]